MKISTNQFTKKTINKGSGSFSDSLTPSSNQFAKKSFLKNSLGWTGPNLNSSAFGAEDIFGGPFSTFGTAEFGGFSHFVLRVAYSLTH